MGSSSRTLSTEAARDGVAGVACGEFFAHACLPRRACDGQAVASRLGVLFAVSLPDLVIVQEAGLRTARNGLRIPDVMVLPAEEDSVWAEQPPIIVVEITSRSTRAEDTLRKREEYARTGAGQYWLLDREHRTLTVVEYDHGIPSVILELDDEERSGEVRVGECGVVAVDLRRLLPDLPAD